MAVTDACRMEHVISSESFEAIKGIFDRARPKKRTSSDVGKRFFFYVFYSTRRAVTGSLFAAFLEGIRPPRRVRRMLSPMRMTAGRGDSTALTSSDPAT